MVNMTPNSSTPDIKTMEDRYQRAQLLMQGIYTNKVTFNDTVFPIWIGDSDCFWYERITKTAEGEVTRFGKEYRLVNANAATNQPASL